MNIIFDNIQLSIIVLKYLCFCYPTNTDFLSRHCNYAPKFEKFGAYWLRLMRWCVRMSVRSRYLLETTCMDSS